MEMDPVPGYKIANWDSGYGDFDLHPDMATLRRIPWLEATALVLCDVAWHDGTPVRPSPRQVLRRRDDGGQPRHLQERHQGDGAPARVRRHVHGEAGSHLDRQLMPCPFEPLEGGAERIRWRVPDLQAVPGRSHRRRS